MFEKYLFKGAIAILAAVAAGLGYDIHQHKKLADKIGMSTKELKESSVKDISESLVQTAVKEAASDKVSSYVAKVNAEVLSTARTQLGDEARKAVKESAEKIRQEVSDRISTEAALIDMTALKNSVREKAEAKVLSKFDGDLGDLLAKYNNNLNNVQKIYGEIASAITRNQDRDKGLKLTLG